MFYLENVKKGDEVYPNVRVFFEYYNGLFGEKGVLCLVIEPETKKILADGYSKCAVTDNFNKNTGRKIAMARAMQEFERPEREKFWNAYFAVRNGRKE